MTVPLENVIGKGCSHLMPFPPHFAIINPRLLSALVMGYFRLQYYIGNEWLWANAGP